MVESPLEMSLLFTLRLLLFYSYYDCQFSIVEFNMNETCSSLFRKQLLLGKQEDVSDGAL